MKTLVIGLSVAFLTTGCATLMTADQQSINVTASNNKSFEVTVDDKTITAPGMVVVLRDGKDKVVKTTAAGCDTATPIEKSIAPVFFGNIVIGGLLGSTTDASTGKMWNYADSVEISCPVK
ncbi:MAG: adenosine deaminase [Alteromonadaceae bacterium]|nr:adenosine deaminase [Alteromonadaceae bacterium]